MRYGQRTSPTKTNSVSPKRRLKTKPLLILIAILFVGHLFWLIAWLIPNEQSFLEVEEVATVNGEKITNKQWIAAMEREVGREVLRNLVNQKVMEAAAKQYGIEVKEEEIDLEIALISSVDGTSISGLEGESMREKVRTDLIFEKVLTNDIVIQEEDIKSYYQENESLYNILTSYRTSAIFVKTKKEAEQTIDELKKGSNFATLAKERSTDLTSASLGGDLGFINRSTAMIDRAITDTVEQIEKGQVSDPIKLSDGTYVILQVSEMIEGRSFSYEEVKDQIRRELALEQLPMTVNPESFWKEFDATWFYGT